MSQKRQLKSARDPERAEHRYTHRNYTYLVTEIGDYPGHKRQWYGQWWGVDGEMCEYGAVWWPQPLSQFLRSVNNTIDTLIAQGTLIDRGPIE